MVGWVPAVQYDSQRIGCFLLSPAMTSLMLQANGLLRHVGDLRYTFTLDLEVINIVNIEVEPVGQSLHSKRAQKRDRK